MKPEPMVGRLLQKLYNLFPQSCRKEVWARGPEGREVGIPVVTAEKPTDMPELDLSLPAFAAG